MQFALATSAASERLQLSFARAESAGGRGQLPSRFFRDAARALIGEPVSAARIDELPAWLFRRVSARELGGGARATRLSLDEYDRALLESRPKLGAQLLAGTRSTVQRALAAQDARWRTRELTAYDGVLGPDALEALLARMGPERPLSPTSLSRPTPPARTASSARTCSRLSELEEPEAIERIDALTRGTLIHRIMQRFLEGLDGAKPSEKGRKKDLAQLRRIAAGGVRRGREQRPHRLPRAVAPRSPLAAGGPRHVVRDRDRGRAAGRLRQRGVRGALRRTVVGRGDQSHVGATTRSRSTSAGVRLRLHGRIDRLEWPTDGAGMRVIDYKTGSTWGAPDDDEALGGRALQLPLYLIAAGALLEARPREGRGRVLLRDPPRRLRARELRRRGARGRGQRECGGVAASAARGHPRGRLPRGARQDQEGRARHEQLQVLRPRSRVRLIACEAARAQGSRPARGGV